MDSIDNHFGAKGAQGNGKTQLVLVQFGCVHQAEPLCESRSAKVAGSTIRRPSATKTKSTTGGLVLKKRKKWLVKPMKALKLTLLKSFRTGLMLNIQKLAN